LRIHGTLATKPQPIPPETVRRTASAVAAFLVTVLFIPLFLLLIVVGLDAVTRVRRCRDAPSALWVVVPGRYRPGQRTSEKPELRGVTNRTLIDPKEKSWKIRSGH
jgi:hypothetical protein